MIGKNHYFLSAISLYFLLALSLASCSSSEKTEEKKNLPTIPQEFVSPPVAPVVSTVNLDENFNKDLNKVWSSYFTEDFTDSKAINVFVVTNRNLKQGNVLGCSDDYFGVGVDKVSRTILCKVNVPKDHSTGEIKAATNSRDSSHEFFKVMNIKSLEQSKMLDFLKKSQRIPLVFVHGFNVKFQEAIFRAAQIAYDLKYQGPVVLFSWPAGAGDGFLDDKLINRTYKSNSTTAKESILVFKDFLESLKKNDLSVNLLVHSMGHQVVLPALQMFATMNPAIDDAKPLIHELILNAPDYEIGKFGDMSERLNQLTKRVTLYCSFNDNAMVASEVMNNTKRLGACALIDNIDTINVSLIDSPTMGVGLGHGYYSSRPILTDVFQVLLGISAEKRLFIKKSEPNSTEKYYLRP